MEDWDILASSRRGWGYTDFCRKRGKVVLVSLGGKR